jgi:hypothetical protein
LPSVSALSGFIATISPVFFVIMSKALAISVVSGKANRIDPEPSSQCRPEGQEARRRPRNGLPAEPQDLGVRNK